jgi:hypothetical protein
MKLSLKLGFQISVVLWIIGTIWAIGAAQGDGHTQSAAALNDPGQPTKADSAPSTPSTTAAQMNQPSKPAASSAPAVPPDAVIRHVSTNQTDFDVTDAIAQGNSVTVNLTVNNNGVDRKLALFRDQYRCATLYDPEGNKWKASELRIANSTSGRYVMVRELLIHGVPTNVAMRFDGVSTMAGQVSFEKITRLDVPLVLSNADFFYNLAYGNPNDPEGLTDIMFQNVALIHK